MKTKNKKYEEFYLLLMKSTLVLSILLFVGCERNNPDDYVPEYENGYIMTCKIDEEDWFHYSGNISAPEHLDVRFSKSNFGGGLLTISGFNTANNPFRNAVWLWLWVNEDYNQIEWATNNPLACYRDIHLLETCGEFNYHLDTNFVNTFVLESFDTTNQEVIGRFEFTAINKDCSDTVHISSGYFDVYYE